MYYKPGVIIVDMTCNMCCILDTIRYDIVSAQRKKEMKSCPDPKVPTKAFPNNPFLLKREKRTTCSPNPGSEERIDIVGGEPRIDS